MLRNKFYDSLKKILFAFVATMFVAPAFSATLPTGYTQLEYLESDGSQYIDTGLALQTATDDIELIYQANETTSGNSLFGARASTSGSVYTFAISSTLKYRVGWNSSTPTLELDADTNKHTLKIEHNGGVFKLDGTTIATQGNANITTPTTATLFAIHATSSTTIYYGTVKIYEYKMWRNGTLTQHMIPVKYVSGNTTTYGMYDLADSNSATAFYTNKGTGTFTAGPMACNGTRVNYTTATGTVVQNGTPTPTNPITPTFYQQGDMVLRKVGDYADSYDSATGKITRRVGVKVLDGTEDWFYESSNYLGSMYNLIINDMFAEASSVTSNRQSPYSTHFARSTDWISSSAETRLNKIQAYTPSAGTPILGLGYSSSSVSTANIPTFKSWLAEQYAAGTPVIVYYPLKTAVVEDWPAEQCIVSDGIKIATTKYNEDAFANLVTTLNSAITKVTNIVDTTVAQASSIGTLATTKQDRPADGDCPAGRKCLLVTGTDGKPHWYLIQE